MEKTSKILLWAISLSVLLAIFATAFIFLFLKKYDFTVEASCDPAEETCFYRDCSTGECPPNELEYYRIFLVPAADFEKCSDSSCLLECTKGVISCEEITCSVEDGDECAMEEDHAEPVVITPVIREGRLTENNTSTSSASSTLEAIAEVQTEQSATSSLEDESDI